MPATRNWKSIFIKTLRDTNNVRRSCLAAGVSRTMAYKAKETDKRFAAAWQEALEDACDVMEAEAQRRALAGVRRVRPIFHMGVQIAQEETIEYSDTLLIFLLKAHRPEKYRERVDVSLKKDLSKLTEEELHVALAIAQKLSDR